MLLVLQNIAYGLNFGFYIKNGSYFSNNMNVSFAFFDTLVQLIICYICFALGSDKQLKYFNMLLISDQMGNLRVVFERKSIRKTVRTSTNISSDFEEYEELQDSRSYS